MPEFVQCDICDRADVKGNSGDFSRCTGCSRVMCTYHARAQGAAQRESIAGKIWGMVGDLKCPVCGSFVSIM